MTIEEKKIYAESLIGHEVEFQVGESKVKDVASKCWLVSDMNTYLLKFETFKYSINCDIVRRVDAIANT